MTIRTTPPGKTPITPTTPPVVDGGSTTTPKPAAEQPAEAPDEEEDVPTAEELELPDADGEEALDDAVDRVATLNGKAGKVPDYDLMFGMRGHVKDGQNARLLNVMQRAVAMAPELKDSAIARSLEAGELKPADIEAMQKFLQEKGYGVGNTGADGKYGPRTHAALAAFVNGEAPTSAEALSLGDRGAGVKEIQERLNAHGHNLKVDGQFGVKTRAALMSFQRAQRLAPNGEAGAETLAQLRKSPSDAPSLPTNVPVPQPRPADLPQGAAPSTGETPLLKTDSRGLAVTRVQSRLTELGYDAGPADGEFGPRTQSALMAFQKDRGLEATGETDPKTWEALGIKIETPQLASMSREELKELGRTDKQAFLEALRPAAEEGERIYGVPASVTLAQAALETGWGQHIPQGFNLFGIKGRGSAGSIALRTQEHVNGRVVTITDNFAKYNDFYESVVAHGRLFHNGYYDKAINQFKQDGSAENFVRNIHGIYATDRDYQGKVLSIMQEYNL